MAGIVGLKPHTKWYIAAIVWAIVAAIGFILLFTISDSPRLLSLAEILSLAGCLGSWLSFATGATSQGQNEMLRRQDETLKRQAEMLKRQDEALAVLREIRDILLKRKPAS